MTKANRLLQKSVRKRDIDGIRAAFAAGANPYVGGLGSGEFFQHTLSLKLSKIPECFVDAFIEDLRKTGKLQLKYIGVIYNTLRRDRLDLTKMLLDGLCHVREGMDTAYLLLPDKAKKRNDSKDAVTLLDNFLAKLHERDVVALREVAVELSQMEDNPVALKKPEVSPIIRSLARVFVRAKNRRLSHAIEDENLNAVEQCLAQGATPLTFLPPNLLERALESSPPDIQERLVQACAEQEKASSDYFIAINAVARKNIEYLETLLNGLEAAENSEMAFWYMDETVERLANEGRYKAAALIAVTLANIHEKHAVVSVTPTAALAHNSSVS